MKLIIFIVFFAHLFCLAGHDPARFLTFDNFYLRTQGNDFIGFDKYGFEYNVISCDVVDCAKWMSLSLSYQIAGVPESPLYPYLDQISGKKYLVYRQAKGNAVSLKQLSPVQLAHVAMLSHIASGFDFETPLAGIKILNNSIYLDWSKLIHGKSDVLLYQIKQVVSKSMSYFFNKELSDGFSRLLKNQENILAKLPYSDSQLLIKWQEIHSYFILQLEKKKTTQVLPRISDVASNIYEEMWKFFFSNKLYSEKLMSEISDQKSSSFYVSSQEINSIKKEKNLINFLPEEKILIIAPSNDYESRRIHDLAKELGIKTLDTRKNSGDVLSRLEVENILKVVQERKISKLIIVETQISPDDLHLLEKYVLSLVDIDHHFNGDVDKWQPVSSIEQLHYALGLELQNNEFLIGAKDRAGSLGGLHYGEDLPATQSNALLSKIKETKWGKTYITEQVTNISEYNSYFLDKAKKIENIFAFNPQQGWIVMGNSKFVMSIRDFIAPHLKDIKFYMGGDKGIKMFLGIKDRDPTKINQIKKLLLQKFPELASCDTYFTH